MAEEAMVIDFAEAAEKAGLETIKLDPVPVKPMNVPVVVGSAVGGTTLGMLLMWGVPKIFGAIKKKVQKGKETDKEIDAKIKEIKAEAEDDQDSDEDEEF